VSFGRSELTVRAPRDCSVLRALHFGLPPGNEEDTLSKVLSRLNISPKTRSSETKNNFAFKDELSSNCR
jgi:hypothetical protein